MCVKDSTELVLLKVYNPAVLITAQVQFICALKDSVAQPALCLDRVEKDTDVSEVFAA